MDVICLCVALQIKPAVDALLKKRRVLASPDSARNLAASLPASILA